MHKPWTLAALAGLFAMTWALPTYAQSNTQPQDRLSLRLGINYSVLDRPADQPGDITILSGSAFVGTGLALGLSYEWTGLAPLSLESGLFYSKSNASGLQTKGDAQQEALLESSAIRVPVWGKYRAKITDSVALVIGAGPELLLGVGSASTLREKNVDEATTQPLETASVTTVQLTGLFSVEVDLGPAVIPLSIHGSFNPLTGAKTQDRLEGFVSPQQPGALKMEFSYEILFLMGFSYKI